MDGARKLRAAQDNRDMTIICVSWETIHLHGEAWVSHHRLRHRLFVERRGWRLPNHNGLEYDQFDTPAARYLIWLDAQRQARAVTRLIPTTEPYMIRQLWPDWSSIDLPEAGGIWEASRFGCDYRLPARRRRRIIGELLCACQEFGVARGIEQYLCVMPLFILRRVIMAAGCPVELLSPPRAIDGLETAIASIKVSPAVLASVRQRTGASESHFKSRKGRVIA